MKRWHLGIAIFLLEVVFVLTMTGMVIGSSGQVRAEKTVNGAHAVSSGVDVKNTPAAIALPAPAAQEYQQIKQLALDAQGAYNWLQSFIVDKDSPCAKELIARALSDAQLKAERYRAFIAEQRYSLDIPKGFVFSPDKAAFLPAEK